MDDLVAVSLWKAAAGGTDNCALLRRPDGWALRGQAGGEVAWLGRLYAAYEVVSDGAWRTTETTVLAADAEGRWRRRLLRRDAAGHWFADDREVPGVDGCAVVDLGMTPATNTCAIRFLALRPGESAELDAAWVRFPGLG